MMISHERVHQLYNAARQNRVSVSPATLLDALRVSISDGCMAPNVVTLIERAEWELSNGIGQLAEGGHSRLL